MKKIYILLSLTLLLSSNLYANDKDTLTVYTYDSFVSEWGPGPIIKEIFEEKFDANLELIAVDSAATLLSKIILEGKTSKADVVLGLDMNLLDAANKSDLFQKHSLKNLDQLIQLPIRWESDNFIPYNYGYFAFVYNNKKFKNPPKSMNELINETKKKESGFYLYDYEKLSNTIDFLEKNKRTSILIGIVPSLFSFGKLFPKKLNHTIIMET